MADTGPYPMGTAFGPYVLDQYIGKGAFKYVYKARNTGSELEEPRVALAFPRDVDDDVLRLMHKEFDAQVMLEHPNIMRVYALEEQGNTPYLVMAWLDGGSLRDRLAPCHPNGSPEPLEEDLALRTIGRLAEALEYTHSAGVFHRDIKPDNIIITRDNVPKLIDFGIARIMQSRSYASTRLGTLSYMAPEVFDGASGYPADIWSLGITFYEMLAGVRPFDGASEGETMRNIMTAPLDLEPLRKSRIDDRVIGIVKRMLEKDPDDRYNARELANDIEIVARRIRLVNDDESRLEVLIRASFPCINIISFEEERVLEAVRRIAGRRGERRSNAEPLKVYIWSASRGLRDENDKLVQRKTHGDPTVALSHVIQSKKEAIFLFLDMHRHFGPPVIRLVRDAARAVRGKHKFMLFLSPYYSLPAELEKEASLAVFQLPDKKEFEPLIEVLEKRVDEMGLPVELETGDRRALMRAASGLTLNEAERAFRAAVERCGALNRNVSVEVIKEKTQIIRKTGILEFYPQAESFKNVGGLTELRDWFDKRLPAFNEEGGRAGLPLPKGVLLVGIPGCGKSLTARALSSAWNAPLLRLDIGRIFGSIVGKSESNLRSAIETAEAVSPCILWIDEVEKGFAGAGSRRPGDSGVAARVFGTFLSWMQEKRSPVFVVATANKIEALPPEFLRKGRFDEIFFVGLPGPNERDAIWRIHLAKRSRDPDDFDIETLVERSKGFSGAEIEQTVIDALFRAFDARQQEPSRDLRDDDLTATLENTTPLATSRPQDIQQLLAWAEHNARMAG
jgi:serine/threonine protein kinase/SpoVK/Ycf46/Vps4 family AAA+-type ATPase